MLLFCRNCGKELGTTPVKVCAHCRSNPVRASNYCRYCGRATKEEIAVCPNCKALIKPLPSIVKSAFNAHPRLVKLGRVISITIISIGGLLYIWFSIPPRAIQHLESAKDAVVMSATGYSQFPLSSVSAFPPIVPPETALMNVPVPVRLFTINTTQQLTIFANYLDASGSTLSASGHSEDVTSKAEYYSNNDIIATVSSTGLITGVSPGVTIIDVSYTASPGSANLTASAEGKEKITVTCRVRVTVAPVPVTEITVNR